MIQEKEITILDCIRNTINNSFENATYIEKQITRKELLKVIEDLRGSKNHVSQVDRIRNFLIKCGYLETMIPGKFQIIKLIPLDITCNQLLIDAYPSNKELQEKKAMSKLKSLFKEELITRDRYDKLHSLLKGTDQDAKKLATEIVLEKSKLL